MFFLANLLILLSLAVIIIQDFKQRQISWFLIPLALSGFVCKAILSDNDVLKDFLTNSVFLLIQLLFLTLYFSIKNKKIVNIINSHLGLGDVLFFVVICSVFSPVNFIAFYLFSMIITLLTILVYHLVSGKQIRSIPLAGAMATVLICLITTSLVFPQLDFYNDNYLLNLLHH